MDEVGTTEIVAWWGAIVAMLVLVWDVVKWAKNGPIIKSRIALNIHYDDGKILKTEKTEHGEVTTYAEYCHVELANIGNMPTTIISISATHKPRKGTAQIGVLQQAFAEHDGKKLPHVLAPGEHWSCRLEMSRYLKIAQHGIPEIRISLSHKNKPLVVKASKSANQQFQLTAKNAD